MKAHEWDTTENVDAMLTTVKGQVSDRKAFLIACGCCRLIEGSDSLRLTADRLEALADRPMKSYEKISILSAVSELVFGGTLPFLDYFFRGSELGAWQLTRSATSLLRQFTARRQNPDGPTDDANLLVPTNDPTSPEQAAVVRELLGNPLRPVTFDPRWRTEAVVGLAEAIEEENAWDRMPILADAIQDAGCEVQEFLAHCRAATVHRRGCWVLDAILGRP